MKIKNKGKVYPSPPPSSSSSSSSSGANRDGDVLSVLKLLPAAILALASVLSLEDREVLAYMITRSLKTTTTNNPSSILQDSKKKSSKKLQNNNNSQNSNHRAPIFDCDCFDCYRSYWFRWDSSPNRELVHQVIEAFEEHLTSGEMSRKNTKGKRRDKTGPRVGGKSVLDVPGQPEILPALETGDTAAHESPPAGSSADVVSVNVGCPDNVLSSEKITEREEMEEAVKLHDEVPEEVVAGEAEVVAEAHGVAVCSHHHKGLARKVLPDVLGLLNSRLWSLWSPNV
ncbi:F12F1.11-RELATED [Salix viminalis]|uniref:F12F1.11-RELATED n=1 Tax=Salix viminalis TaxID=40686 RepID=A0A6N2JWS3_SALVM|nr:F12F1.11-RELATED [Salix viminalis]